MLLILLSKKTQVATQIMFLHVSRSVLRFHQSLFEICPVFPLNTGRKTGCILLKGPQRDSVDDYLAEIEFYTQIHMYHVPHRIWTRILKYDNLL